MTLCIDGVDKTYGGRYGKPVHAVRDLSLAVADGDLVALLGSSGCGKTSTLRMIAGFEDVTRGHINLAGRRIETLPPPRRKVAMAFEGYALYPPLTIEQNIGFGLTERGLDRNEAKRRVREMAEMLEISAILPRRPNNLSGGQQQRASLARALARDADLYLLDEPMGQLEPQLRAVLRGRVKAALKQRGMTAVLVTHDQTEANAMADKIAVMEGGVLQQSRPARRTARRARQPVRGDLSRRAADERAWRRGRRRRRGAGRHAGPHGAAAGNEAAGARHARGAGHPAASRASRHRRAAGQRGVQPVARRSGACRA